MSKVACVPFAGRTLLLEMRRLMQTQQLILSPLEDINASAICWALRAGGQCPVWSRSASLADVAIGPVSLHSDGTSEWSSGSGLEASRFGSVWYRWARPRTEFFNALECDASFLKREWKLFESNVYALGSRIIDAFWVNPPAAADLAENKLIQLQAAVHCGVSFPATLVSNDPEKIKSFVRQNPRTIYKPFVPHGWKDRRTGRMFHTPATILDQETELDDSVLQMCPGIFQAYIDKTTDIRITVIGDRFFPVKINSSASEAYVDWRSHVDQSDFRAEPYVLPDEYTKKLKALMRRLNLVYGCIDLVRDRRGEYHFLEVNQVGQFLFIERWIDSLPLLQAMSAMFVECRSDYSLESCPAVSYREYLASEDHEVWRKEVSEAIERRSVDDHGGFSLEDQAMSN